MRQRKSALFTLFAVLFTVFISFAFIPGAAHAADADGCKGNAASFTSGGKALDLAYAPGIGGTEEHPFVIDLDGKVQWEGSTDQVLKSGTYSITVGGFPVKSGEFTNEAGQNKSEGTYNLSELPDGLTFFMGSLGDSKVPVTAEVTGPEGTCTASGYITGSGSPFASPLFYSGLLLILIFFLLLLGILYL